ncbi:MAG: DegV family protein, partial [Candidatus Heimdallarchaeota archaeon]
MQKVAIVTDGSCDLPKELIEKYDIFIAPFQVIFGSEAYKMYGDFGDLTKDEFYEKLLTEKELPTTSIPSPKSFSDAFESALKHANSVIGIFISKQLSGTYQSAFRVAKEMFEGKDIELIDSKVAASTLGTLVIEAAKLAKEGKSKEVILEVILTRINELIPHGRLICVMDNVEAAYRSGRLGWTKKFLVNTLKIRPITLFEDGAIVPGGKIKGSREVVIEQLKKVAPHVVKNAITDTIFVWHVRYHEAAQILKEEMEKHNKDNKEIIIQEAGP